MCKWLVLSVSLLVAKPGFAQGSEYGAITILPIGGQAELDQVLSTQLTLPKTLVNRNFAIDVTTFFDLDSAGHAINLSLKGVSDKYMKAELVRIFRFFRFLRTQPVGVPVYPYTTSFHLSSDKYKKYIKQKSRFTPKEKLISDSSLAVHTRADRSPQYYRNAEEGLGEFVLGELEYPDVAKEKSIEGTVRLQFIVETNGFVTGITPVQSVSGGCTEEAIRILRETKWQPATYKGKLVRYQMTYPIMFSLRNQTRNVGYSSQTLGQ